MKVLSRKIRNTIWIAACMLFTCVIYTLTSCKEEEPLKAAYFAFVDDSGGTFAKELLVTPGGGTRTFTLISNRKWEILYDEASWINISPTSGNGVATINITVNPNESLNEDSIFLSIINNTLPVIENFKVKRQNYLANYRGNVWINSPIDSICTTCLTVDSIQANSTLGFANGKTTLNFSTTIKLSSSFLMNMAFEGNMQTLIENGKAKFVYNGTGTYDFTPLGVIINDPTVTGVKNTIIKAELTGGILTSQIVTDPNNDGSIKPGVSTVITFKGNR